MTHEDEDRSWDETIDNVWHRIIICDHLLELKTWRHNDPKPLRGISFTTVTRHLWILRRRLEKSMGKCDRGVSKELSTELTRDITWWSKGKSFGNCSTLDAISDTLIDCWSMCKNQTNPNPTHFRQYFFLFPFFGKGHVYQQDPYIVVRLWKRKKFNGSWGKCLRAGFLTTVEGKRDRWGG